MKVFIVHAHPEPKSFNGALTDLAQRALPEAGHEVRVSDLYAMGFDPVSGRGNFTQAKDPGTYKQQDEELHASDVDGFAPEIAAEHEKLEWCDALVLQFPLWWFSLPAILKGWVDRVFAMGRIYGGGKWYDEGHFQGKRAMLSLTTGGPESIYAKDGLNGDIHAILDPIHHGILRFVGFDVLAPYIAFAPARAGEKGREKNLEQYRRRLLWLHEDDPLSFPPLSAFDESFRRKG